MRRLFAQAAVVATVIAGPVAAYDIRACDGFEANARNVMWSDPTRAFANGAVRFITLDTEEPVCCSHHLMVLHPAGDDPYGACTLITPEGGWTYVDLSGAVAGYDPARGLVVRVPTSVYNGSGSDPSSVEIIVNQATGQVRAR